MTTSPVEKTIRVLEAKNAALQAEITDNDAAIAALRRVAGGSLTRVAPTRLPFRFKKKAAKAASRKVKAKPEKVRRHAAATPPSDIPVAILTALKAAGKPMSPKDLARAAGISTPTLRRHLEPLERKREVTVTGTTFSRRVQLGGVAAEPAHKPQAPAAAAPSTPAHSTRAGMASPDASAVRARDAALIERLKKGPASFTDLLGAMPFEPEMNADQRRKACENAIARLRLKNVAVSDALGYRLA